MSDSPSATRRLSAIDGWFTVGDTPALIGSRCAECGTYYFPRELSSCRNPVCHSKDLAETELSRTGTIWSYTNNLYPPPPPFMATDPFEPYAVIAVELAEEQMVVLGQAAQGSTVDDLHLGMAVELVVEPLYAEEDTEYLVWKWRPVKAKP